METVFWICVKLLVLISHLIGISYQQLNVILFVILHPSFTLFIYLKYKKYKYLYLLNKTQK
jgi:hypothetical protein